jgi:hypothetical protein
MNKNNRGLYSVSKIGYINRKKVRKLRVEPLVLVHGANIKYIGYY